MSKRVVIIGGVAGGASVATRLRRLDESAEIVIYEAGPYISFANCGLPYYVGGKISERDNLLVESVDDMQQDFNIDVHVNSTVTAIDADQQQLTIQGPTGSITDHYDELVLSIGATPVVQSSPVCQMPTTSSPSAPCPTLTKSPPTSTTTTPSVPRSLVVDLSGLKWWKTCVAEA